MKTKGYTISILPPGQEYKRFEMLIKKLAQKCGGPVFAPHITLLGQATDNEAYAFQLGEELIKNQEPFSVTLNKVDYQNYFFRALYVLVEKTEPLMKLHEKAKQIFGKIDVGEYMPHLSLLYGNFEPEIKEKIIQEIGSNQSSTFTVNSLHLFKTEGEAHQWYHAREFSF